MRKKLASLILAMTFVATTATVGLAAYVKCEVKSVHGNTVTLDCGSKADKFKAGDKVKVKDAKRKAIEGC